MGIRFMFYNRIKQLATVPRNRKNLVLLRMSRNSLVGIAMSYRLDGRVSIPSSARFISLHSVQTGCGAPPTYYPMVTGDSFLLGDKAAGA
jgi:hypothetical protein